MKSLLDRIERYLENSFSSPEDVYEKAIYEAMAYSVEAGGKRLRPMLLLLTYRFFAKDEQKEALPLSFAAAIEMIHTYSLIHDDLPAMDNDALRRGKPTCHIVFGEDMAILAGDGLLNKAFEMMLAECLISPTKSHIQAANILATKAGTKGMIGGQVGDIKNETNKIDITTLKEIHLRKTAGLIEAAFMMGASLADQNEETIQLMARLGRKIGLAFQIQDDILDVLSTEAELGKPIGSDQKNNKETYLDFMGLEGCREALIEAFGEARSIIHQSHPEDSPEKRDLLEMIEKIENRKK